MLFRVFACVLLMLAGPVCVAQEITVRVINAANGRPMKKVTVMVSGPPGPQIMLAVRRETDGTGEAHFTLPDPAPRYIVVNAILSSDHWDCGCLATAAPGELIQKGVVAPFGSKPTKAAASLKPTPGQVLFAMRPLSFFERLFMFFMG